MWPIGTEPGQGHRSSAQLLPTAGRPDSSKVTRDLRDSRRDPTEEQASPGPYHFISQNSGHQERSPVCTTEEEVTSYPASGDFPKQL